MSSRLQYSIAEFWADLKSVSAARVSWPKDVSFDESVENHFESIHGDDSDTFWRYGKFMLVCTYITANKTALDTGDLFVAGSYDNLVSDKLCARVLNWAVKHDVANLSEFPPPAFFTGHE